MLSTVVLGIVTLLSQQSSSIAVENNLFEDQSYSESLDTYYPDNDDYSDNFPFPLDSEGWLSLDHQDFQGLFNDYPEVEYEKIENRGIPVAVSSKKGHCVENFGPRVSTAKHFRVELGPSHSFYPEFYRNVTCQHGNNNDDHRGHSNNAVCKPNSYNECVVKTKLVPVFKKSSNKNHNKHCWLPVGSIHVAVGCQCN